MAKSLPVEFLPFLDELQTSQPHRGSCEALGRESSAKVTEYTRER
jgi:hypothetical protein